MLPVVLELIAAGRSDPLAVPTTIVPWDRADEAWLAPATKLVLEREQQSRRLPVTRIDRTWIAGH